MPRTVATTLRGAVIAVALLNTLAATAVAAPPDREGKIVGGRLASRPYPFQAYLQIQTTQGVGRCGGSLVAARWVLTAAHCLQDPNDSPVPPSALTMAIGQPNLDAVTPADIYRAVAIQRHPSFAETPNAIIYDAAVIELDRPAPLEQVRLLRPPDVGAWAPGTPGTIVGWGTIFSMGPTSRQLLEAVIPLRSDEDCAAVFKSVPGNPFSPLTMTCAGTAFGPDTCQGDSGGPLLVADADRLAQAGIVSFGYGCGAQYPGVYSRVAADPLNAWIRDRVPQSEFDVSTLSPVEGEPVSFASAARHPAGAAGYTSLQWDLDADGSFDDAAGASVARAFPAGRITVALEAANAQGDREIRRRTLDVRPAPVVVAPKIVEPEIKARRARILSARRRRSDGALQLRASFPVAGSWRATMRGRGAVARGVLLGSTRGATSRARTLTITLRPGSRARKLLKRHRSITVRLAVEFRAKGQNASLTTARTGTLRPAATTAGKR